MIPIHKISVISNKINNVNKTEYLFVKKICLSLICVSSYSKDYNLVSEISISVSAKTSPKLKTAKDTKS